MLILCRVFKNHCIRSFAGVDFGKAYDIPNSLNNAVFYAAVCLKVSCLMESLIIQRFGFLKFIVCVKEKRATADECNA